MGYCEIVAGPATGKHSESPNGFSLCRTVALDGTGTSLGPSRLAGTVG